MSASQERMVLLLASRLCAAAAPLGIAGVAISLVALVALALADQPLRAAWAWWLAALPGPLAAWLAFRVRVDAWVFADLAGSAADPELRAEERAAAFDAALSTFTGKAADARPGRTPSDRARGARQLLLRLAVVVATQFGCALVATFPG